MLIGASPMPSGLRRVPILQTADLHPRQFPRTFVSLSMRNEGFPKASDDKKEKLGFTDSWIETKPKVLPLGSVSPDPSVLQFDRVQPSDEECYGKHKRVFGGFVAREALLDEELWTAAWLRAESEWEDMDVRHVDSFKRKFAEQEFHALKRRSTGQQLMEKSTCIIVIKKEERNVKRTILSSIVGTLDISVGHLLYGETFPGERLKAHALCNLCVRRRDQHVFVYVSNLCVAKYARRQGIASNMLCLAVEAAETYGANDIYVQVHKDNRAAQKMYEKKGFEIVEAAIPQFLKEKTHLLRLRISSSSSLSSS